MNNKEQPGTAYCDHYTLEQVKQKAKDNFYGGVQFIFSPSELHALKTEQEKL